MAISREDRARPSFSGLLNYCDISHFRFGGATYNGGHMALFAAQSPGYFPTPGKFSPEQLARFGLENNNQTFGKRIVKGIGMKFPQEIKDFLSRQKAQMDRTTGKEPINGSDCITPLESIVGGFSKKSVTEGDGGHPSVLVKAADQIIAQGDKYRPPLGSAFADSSSHGKIRRVRRREDGASARHGLSGKVGGNVTDSVGEYLTYRDFSQRHRNVNGEPIFAETDIRKYRKAQSDIFHREGRVSEREMIVCSLTGGKDVHKITYLHVTTTTDSALHEILVEVAGKMNIPLPIASECADELDALQPFDYITRFEIRPGKPRISLDLFLKRVAERDSYKSRVGFRVRELAEDIGSIGPGIGIGFLKDIAGSCGTEAARSYVEQKLESMKKDERKDNPSTDASTHYEGVPSNTNLVVNDRTLSAWCGIKKIADFNLLIANQGVTDGVRKMPGGEFRYDLTVFLPWLNTHVGDPQSPLGIVVNMLQRYYTSIRRKR